MRGLLERLLMVLLRLKSCPLLVVDPRSLRDSMLLAPLLRHHLRENLVPMSYVHLVRRERDPELEACCCFGFDLVHKRFKALPDVFELADRFEEPYELVELSVCLVLVPSDAGQSVFGLKIKSVGGVVDDHDIAHRPVQEAQVLDEHALGVCAVLPVQEVGG
jgi:hypothetical protein